MDASESRLAARLAAGEAEAFATVYDRHGRDLYGYLLARTRRPHLAEDLLQAVMLRLVRSRERLAKVRNLRAYLFQVARNEWIRRGTRAQPETEALVDAAAPVAQHGGDVDALRSALDRLSPERREVVSLKIHHGLTFAQIDEVLDVPPDTASSRYRRALADLRRLMEATDVDIRPDLEARLAALRPPPPRADLRDEVLAAVRAELDRATRPSFVDRLLAKRSTWAAAAALLLALLATSVIADNAQERRLEALSARPGDSNRSMAGSYLLAWKHRDALLARILHDGGRHD